MANRYWVSGGTGNWSNTSNWSATSGGPRGASAPTSLTGDFVYFDANSGTGVSVLAATVTVVGLNCTGFAGTLSIPTATSLIVAGDATLAATATYTGAGTFTISIPVATTRTLTTNNASLQYTLVSFNGSAQATAIVTLVGALNITQQFRASGCTLNLNSYVVTCGLLRPTGATTFAFGSSGTSAIVIPTGGGANNTSVVDFSVGSGYTSTYSGAQRPILRLTYAGAVGSRKVVDPYGAFDYIWYGADLSNSVSLACQNLDLTNFTGTMATPTLSVSGNLTFGSATPQITSTVAMTFNGTGTQNITTNATSLNCPVTFAGMGSYVLANDMSMGSGTNTTTLTSGTLNLNGKTLTVVNFSSNNSNTRGITFASGKIVATGLSAAWGVATGTGMTITGPGSIELTAFTGSTTTRIFDGGSVAYNGITLILAGTTAGNINLIRGSNSFYSIKNTISPQTILFVSGTTTIFTDNFELNGTAGNNIIITSQGTPANLAAAPNFAKPSGNVVCSYANISWNNAAYTGSPATSTFTSKWTTGVGSVLTANQTSGWTKSAGTAGFLTLFYP